MLERTQASWGVLVVGVFGAVSAGCSGPATPQSGVAAATPPPTFEGERPGGESKTWTFALVAPDGERIELSGYGVGRGGYSVAELESNGFARELNVLTPTWSGEQAWLAFEWVPTAGGADAGWRVALAEGRGDAFHVVAVSEHANADWADWAVATPDGSRVAAWVLDDEHALHLMERRGDELVVTERRHPEAVKAFPRFAPNGRLAARLPLKGERLSYANAIDGVLGERLRAVREVQFDGRGERWAYAGRRADGWYVFAGVDASPGAEAGPFEEVGAFEFDADERVRAHVHDASGWRWVELAPR